MTHELNGTASIDDIQALEALRGEISLTRHAVEGLTAARERIPDYSVTLGQLAQALKLANAGIDHIAQSPAATLSPASLTAEIVKASANARAEDRTLLRQLGDTLSQSIGRVDQIVERGQAAQQQVRDLIWAAAAGAFMATLLMTVIPGAIARALPTGWHVPEWMAARTMRMDQRSAGERLIATAAPVKILVVQPGEAEVPPVVPTPSRRHR